MCSPWPLLSSPPKCSDCRQRRRTCVPHFDGADCRLATRVARMLPPAVETLPPCIIRKECRWYSQEGGAACMRCPEITTVTYDLSSETREVSGLPVITET